MVTTMASENNVTAPEEERIETAPRAGAAPAKRWLWIGVGGCSLLIGTLWVYLLKQQFSLFDWKHSSELELLAKTKTDWEQAFAGDPSEATALVAAKARLETALAQLRNRKQAPTTSSTAVDATTTGR